MTRQLSAPFGSRIDGINRAELSPVQLVSRVVRVASRYDVVLLHGDVDIGEWYSDLICAALLSHRRRPALVLAEAYWEPGSRALARLIGRSELRFGAVNRGAMRLLDSPTVYYCVLSTAELETFPHTWGVDAQRVRFTPFQYTVPPDLLDEATDGDYVFAGGDSLRDYRVLIEAARGLPYPVRIATHQSFDNLPSNVQAMTVSHDRFNELLLGAATVVVPLAGNTLRSAGQQTYLSAMALGKAVIATDAPGAGDHIDHARTGLLVPPGDVEAMRAAIDRTMNPAYANETQSMRAAAQSEARTRFAPVEYSRRLFEIAEFVGQQHARTS
jgi:glycosyltransferase involved in cell wall biosynthesis